MQMLGAMRRAPCARDNAIEIHVAEPYAAESRLLEGRLGIRVVPRANDYELAFPSHWLGNATPIAGLPPDLPVEALAAYRDRPLPARMAEAVLVALELHVDLPRASVGVTAAEFGLPSRTLQYALQDEGVSYRDIVLGLRMRRARQLLASTEETLAEVALRTGYTDASNFHRAFLSLNGMTPGGFREASRATCTIQPGARLRRIRTAGKGG
jgi:AraC-like DNA-binding protein